MRRIALVVGLLAALVVAAPASADFHPACPDGAFAAVNLTASGDTLTFSGSVACGGAESLSIDSLTLQPITPGGSSVSAPPASCTGCENIASSRSAPASVGTYDVTMHYTVVGHDQTFTPVRSARFLWSGAGSPIRVCGHGAGINRCTGIPV